MKSHTALGRVLVYVATLLSTSSSITAGDDATAAAVEVTSPCTEIHFLTKLAQDFSTNLQTAETAQSKLATEYQQLMMEFVQNSGTHRAKGYALLAAVAGDRLVKQKNKLKASKDKIKTAYATLKARIGQLLAPEASTPSTTPAITGAAAATDNNIFGATTQTCTSTTADVQTPVAGCNSKKANMRHLDKASINLIGLKSISLTADKEFAFPGLTLTAAGRGDANSADTGHAAGHYCAAGGQATKSSASTAFGIEKISVTARTNQRANTATSPTPGQTDCPPPGTDHTTGIITAQQIAAAICTAARSQIVSERTIKETDNSGLRTDATAKKAALLLHDLKAETTEKDPSKTTQLEEKAILAVLGPADADVKTAYLDPLAHVTTTIHLGTGEATGHVEQLVEGTDHGTALAFFVAKSEASRQATPITPAPTAELPGCQNKKKSDCDKEASCEWKGSEEKGKCEAKGGEDGVKVENDGKTTNNTCRFCCNQSISFACIFASRIKL
uniref:Variant surface glycoprotein 1125.4309 n=1 Tax=Trypanosoma brucei TaxID=5691 RepID=A0A1J0RAE1_9TRYP|nr:variant surface glycoprotein 1125.4309 [Trypanosoma brucei]